MNLKEHWEELKAQVDAHGIDSVDFYLANEDTEENDPVYITNVKYDGGRINVEFEM